MSLPLLATPTFELELPSNKEKVTFRPFLVKEEKMLLIAQESDDEKDTIKAVKQIIKACVLSGKVDIDKMPSFDIEYLFLNIRAKSVGEIVELQYHHVDGNNKAGVECNHVQDIEINLEAVDVVFPKGHESKINITGDIGVKMKYPTFEIIESKAKIKNQVEQTFLIMLDCVEMIWEGDTVHDEFTKKELEEFFDSMTKDQFQEVTNFFETMPKLSHEIKYTCGGCGEEESVVVEGLQNFFT